MNSNDTGGIVGNKENKKIDHEENREKNRKDEKETEEFIYIGETARSVMEIRLVHFKDLIF